jgi:putative flippase GtrA
MREVGESVRVTRGFSERPWTAAVVAKAMAEFEADDPGGFAPLVVVIAALDEAENLPSVLDEIPARIGGVAAEVLVIDDGSSDDTADVALSHGARVVRLSRNCGHGVALRVGYRLAKERGGRYVATLDADGQWDPTNLPDMMRLVAGDHADLVIGSRVLGSTMNTDSVRNAGVRFFGWLTQILTGVAVTDTSSGLRLMKVEIPATVPQTQPQYQTSELLIGALMAGWRVAEVPTVMRPRLSGESRKGRNFTYGLRYARVMVGTWWRESHREGRPVLQRRPMLSQRVVRYALGSVICLVVSEITLAILLAVGTEAWVASVCASAAGIVPGYPLNRTWTFGKRGRSHKWREVLPYWTTSIASAVVAALVVAGVNIWVRHVTQDHVARKIILLAAYVAAYGFMWLLRFVYMDRVLFAPKRVPVAEGVPARAGAAVLPLSPRSHPVAAEHPLHVEVTHPRHVRVLEVDHEVAEAEEA